MPLVGPVTNNIVFWNTEDILNFARVLVNDAQGSLAGQDLADDRPYTWTLLNLCYGKLANWLEDSNVESAMYAEAILSLPVNAPAADPNAQTVLSYEGFYDANGNRYEYPTLPPDLVEPLTIWGRQTGANQEFMEIPQQLGGLSAYAGASNYGAWEFRQMSVYFSGGTFAAWDIKLRYIPSFAALVQPTPENPTPPNIPFARAGEALGYMVAAEYLEIRGAANAPIIRMKANEQLQILANKSAKRENNAQTRRKGYGFGGGRRRGVWPREYA